MEEVLVKKKEKLEGKGEDEVDKGFYQRVIREVVFEELEEIMLIIFKVQWKVFRSFKDIIVIETEEVVFECEFNVFKVRVIWKINGVEIE